MGLILSSTLARVDCGPAEQLKLRAALPADVVAVLDRHDKRGHLRRPRVRGGDGGYLDRHLYRGPKPRAELERMIAEKATDVYRAMQGPNEWTVTGAIKAGTCETG